MMDRNYCFFSCLTVQCGTSNFNVHAIVLFLQVETVAQFGVIFLLFALGLEFSAAKV